MLRYGLIVCFFCIVPVVQAAQVCLQSKDDQAECANKRASAIEMSTLPSGDFVMGSQDYLSEQPVKTVHVRAFRIATTEVTRALFLRFVKDTGYPGGHCFQNKSGAWQESGEGSWSDVGFAQTADHPAVCISWNDAQTFLDWLNTERRPDRPYRLPSEAEWEYAARAGVKTRFGWGESFSNNAHALLNCDDLLCADGYPFTAPVGSFPPNVFGLYDMVGSVWEWTADCWQGDYKNTPTDGSPNLNGDCNFRVVKGGSFASKATAYLRFSNRDSDDIDSRNANTGFRIAQDLE